MQVGDDRILSMFLEIRQELSELKGEMKGFNSSIAKIDTANENAQKALAIAIETQHKQAEFEHDYAEHREQQAKRAKEAAAERRTTKRWIIGLALSIITLIVNGLIRWFK